MEMKARIKEKAVEGFSQARAFVYTIESLPLPTLNKVITGQERRRPSQDEQNHIIKNVKDLLQLDAKDFSQHNIPLSCLSPEKPFEHLQRWINILGDSALSLWRKRNNKTTEFSRRVKNLDRFPKYYQRNFHHQTDGYLSDESARLYEHQVELLFRGTAAPMRRRLLPPLMKSLYGRKKTKILELACGTGAFTKYLVACFPEAQITAVDLSPNYINAAKKQFLGTRNLDFMVLNAEELPFKNQSFDAVVSVYLHHELPGKIRQRVIGESLRVLQPRGFWGMVDSIQLGDDKKLDWAIEDFPKSFHEPFFTHYIRNPLKPWLSENFRTRKFEEEIHLLSKVVYSDGKKKK